MIKDTLKMERIKLKPIVKTYRHKKGSRKSSIKITVSADIPSDLTPFSPVTTTTTVVKRRVMTFGPGVDGIVMKETDSLFGGDDDDDCFAEGNAFTTRITVDDSIVDFPDCVDFGIKDFLCCEDEIDLELSSDTDASFLEATPPHRFSDSEFESQIEAMSITIDSSLQLESSSSHQNVKIERNMSLSEENHHGESQIFGRRILPAPPRPFRRHISLPASIFMSYLLAAEQSWKEKVEVPGESQKHSKSRKLSKIDGSMSSSNESSTEVEEEESDEETSSTPKESSSESRRESNTAFSNDVFSFAKSKSHKNWTLSREGSRLALGSAEELDRDDDDLEDGDQEPAFTSEIERKSLVLRHVRKLIRQDTSGNFAPPDYCI